jgi:NADH-quinone oxidoreductase subunit J
VSALIFYPLALATVLAAIGVIATRNPVRSALSLVTTLFLLSISYACLSAHLVAALQIIVYTGAVMVLFLFVITLLNLQEDPSESLRGFATALGVGSGLAIAVALGVAIYSSDAAHAVGDSLPEGFGTTQVLARTMFSDHIVAFELTSILLLVAVVGAVVLAKRDPPPQAAGQATEL